MRRVSIAIGLAFTLVVVVACGGGPATTSGQTSAAAATAAATTAATPAATAVPTAAGGPSLTDILKAGKLASYKVTYKWAITAGGQTVDSQQTWYYKPPKARFDYSIGGIAAQSGASFSLFVLEDGTYLCTRLGAAASCQKTPQESAVQQNPAADFDLQVLGRPDQVNATFQGSKTIAGQQAQCYNVKGLTGSFGDVTGCYSTTGVPLSMQMTSQGSTLSMEATSFSTTVADSDFQLPGPVR
ncbi:MAG TPA: hypothetical protein VGA16_11815 [Candidatus Limnocylindria bacterium]